MDCIEGSTFLSADAIDGKPSTHGNGSTIGCNVPDEATGDSWHQTGLENGGIDCEDPPGTREGMGVKMYLAYVKDPSGKKICVLKRLA